MFTVNMRACGVWRIDSYAEAKAFYDTCKAPRGSDYGDARPIRGKESSRGTMNVRIEDGHIKFRFHSTDVVQWRPDNTIRVVPYQSTSTCTFANSFLPVGVHLLRDARCLRIADTFYPVGSTFVIDGHNVSHEEGHPVFIRWLVNRKRARQALAATRYADYRAWYNIMIPMMRNSMQQVWNRPWLSDTDLLAALADETRWHDLMMSYVGNPDHVRSVIYRMNSVKDCAVADSLTTADNTPAWQVSDRMHYA